MSLLIDTFVKFIFLISNYFISSLFEFYYLNAEKASHVVLFCLQFLTSLHFHVYFMIVIFQCTGYLCRYFSI